MDVHPLSNRFRLQRPPEPAPDAFVACPIQTTPGQWAWQQELYARALAEAQAVARPALPELDLLGVWN